MNHDETLKNKTHDDLRNPKQFFRNEWPEETGQVGGQVALWSETSTAAITIHYKKAELTKGCIKSLLADGWAPILVWDNSDDEGESLRELQSDWAGDARLQWESSPANVGFGKGMNGALAALGARGYHGPVLLVNNDVQVDFGMRAALLAELSGAAGTVLVAPRIVQDSQEQGWLYYHPWLALVTRRHLPGSFAYLSGCCLLVQRPDNTQPLFDEAFFMYGEDVELSWRIRRQGGQLQLLERSFICHAGSASSGQASMAYERFLVHSHWLLAEKLAPNALSGTLMRALRIPSLFARACLRVLRYRSLVPLQGLLRSGRPAVGAIGGVPTPE